MWLHTFGNLVCLVKLSDHNSEFLLYFTCIFLVFVGDYIHKFTRENMSSFLQALSLIESEDLVQEERARKAAVRKSKMDADLDAESADLQEKKGVGCHW